MFMHRVSLAEKLAQMFMLAITGSTVKGRAGGVWKEQSRDDNGEDNEKYDRFWRGR